MSIFRARTRSVIAAAAVAACLVALGGCSTITDLLGSDATRDEDTQEITEAGDADVFTLQVGDCLNEVSSDLVSEVPVVPCSEPHDEEIFFEFRLDGDTYPGVEAIDKAADEACNREFETFVGMSYQESALGWYRYAPTEEGWDQLNDRVVQCVIYDPAGQVTGSLAGANR